MDDIIRFRQRFRPGDIVEGKILHFEAPGLAWISVEKLCLLARTRFNYPVGQKLYFLVKQLYPQIILKEADRDMKKAKLNIVV